MADHYKGLCPECITYGDISLDFAILSPIELPEDDKSPYISLALMDENRRIWWDEIVQCEDGMRIAMIRLPENVGFIPRWVIDFQNGGILDPVSLREAHLKSSVTEHVV